MYCVVGFCLGKERVKEGRKGEKKREGECWMDWPWMGGRGGPPLPGKGERECLSRAAEIPAPSLHPGFFHRLLPEALGGILAVI